MSVIYLTNTSASRFAHRQKLWKDRHRVAPTVRHHAWWLLHNLIAHPVLGLRPSPRVVWFHDWTSQHLNTRRRFVASPPPVIPPGKERAWRFHNIVGDVAFGLAPIEAAFRFHDRTSEAMGVSDWV